jgi:thiopeptide-type bacteriocin biosynthesis protein
MRWSGCGYSRLLQTHGIRLEMWHYRQIYLSKGDDQSVPYRNLVTLCDELLLDAVMPVIVRWRDKIERYFFLRYSEQGYHLRLRVFADTELFHQQIEPDLRDAADAFRQVRAHLMSIDSAHYFQRATYQPELDKYGGEAGMRAAESHFHTSSETVIDVMRRERFMQIPRSLYAAALMKTAFETAYQNSPSIAAQLMAYAEYWLIGQSNKPKLLAEGKTLAKKKRASYPIIDELCSDPVTLKWRTQLEDDFEALFALEQDKMLNTSIHHHLVQQASLIDLPVLRQYPITMLLILPNFVHTFNNRLGVSPLQEVQLALMLYHHWYSNYPALPLSPILEPTQSHWLLNYYKSRYSPHKPLIIRS